MEKFLDIINFILANRWWILLLAIFIITLLPLVDFIDRVVINKSSDFEYALPKHIVKILKRNYKKKGRKNRPRKKHLETSSKRSSKLRRNK